MKRKRKNHKRKQFVFHQYNKPVNGTLTHRDIEIMYKDGVKTMKEIDRRYFLSLNQDIRHPWHYYILCDQNYEDDFIADSEEEAKKIFSDYKRK